MSNKYAQQNNHIIGVTIDEMEIYVWDPSAHWIYESKEHKNVLGNQV